MLDDGVKMSFRSVLYAWFLAILASVAQAQADPDTNDTLLGDARAIITSSNDDVRLWAHPPRMLVLGDQDTHAAVRDIVSLIDSTVQSPFGARFFGNVQYEPLPRRIGTGQGRMSIRIREGGPSGREVHANLGEGFEFQTDIVVVVADRTTVGLINGLWGLSINDNRAMLEGGRSRCFYSARSSEGARLGAMVTIFPIPAFEFTEECLWEEIVHTLGPLGDAVGSRFFSFDNEAVFLSDLPEGQRRALNADKRANDLLLLRALYESGAGPGGSPDTVIDYLGTLTSER